MNYYIDLITYDGFKPEQNKTLNYFRDLKASPITNVLFDSEYGTR